MMFFCRHDVVLYNDNESREKTIFKVINSFDDSVLRLKQALCSYKAVGGNIYRSSRMLFSLMYTHFNNYLAEIRYII